jgi:protein-S-isoprenylcysteine O-methyltransferase Ste14
MTTLRTWLKRALLLLLVMAFLLPSLFWYAIGLYAFIVLPTIDRSFFYFHNLEAFAIAFWMLASGWGLIALLWLVLFHHRRTFQQMPSAVRRGLVVGVMCAGVMAYWVVTELPSQEAWLGLSLFGGGPLVVMLMLFARMQPHDKFECLLPPPFVAAVTAFTMMLVTHALPQDRGLAMNLAYANAVVAGVLAVLGLAVAVAGVWAFQQAHTTVNPLMPANATTLVSGGVYQYSRNPMYLGLALLLLSLVIWLGSLMSLLPWGLFVTYLTRFQIRPEERALQCLFGAEYDVYAQRVRRWL